MPRKERRKHKRHDIPCPAQLFNGQGEAVSGDKTVNISDGGLLMPIPSDSAVTPGEQVSLYFSLPRATANTYMLEHITADALVVRVDPTADEDRHNLAVQFAKPLNLQVEA